MKYLNHLISRLRLMSNEDKVHRLHTLIDKSDNKPEEKKILHEDLKAANGDQAVIDEIETHVTPREIAKEITEGKREPEHLGDHTPETLTQEIVSLGNTKPMFRDKDWNKRAETVSKAIAENMKKDPRQYQGLNNKLHDIVQGEL